jgi:hypothetical protein
MGVCPETILLVGVLWGVLMVLLQHQGQQVQMVIQEYVAEVEVEEEEQMQLTQTVLMVEMVVLPEVEVVVEDGQITPQQQ